MSIIATATSTAVLSNFHCTVYRVEDQIDNRPKFWFKNLDNVNILTNKNVAFFNDVFYSFIQKNIPTKDYETSAVNPIHTKGYHKDNCYFIVEIREEKYFDLLMLIFGDKFIKNETYSRRNFTLYELKRNF